MQGASRPPLLACAAPRVLLGGRSMCRCVCVCAFVYLLVYVCPVTRKARDYRDCCRLLSPCMQSVRRQPALCTRAHTAPRNTPVAGHARTRRFAVHLAKLTQQQQHLVSWAFERIKHAAMRAV